MKYQVTVKEIPEMTVYSAETILEKTPAAAAVPEAAAAAEEVAINKYELI